MTDKTDKKVKSLIAKFTAGGDDERDKTAEALALKGKVTRSIQGRINAARELGRIGDPQAVPVLVQARKDKKRHYLVQTYASIALGEIRNPQAIPSLIEALNDKGIDTFTYGQMVESLIAMRDPQTVPGLIRASSSKDEEVRVKAAEALGTLKDERAVPALIAALNDRHSVTQYRTDEYGTKSVGTTQYVCDEAAAALGKIGDAHAVPALSEVLQDKRYDIRTCGCAIRALGAIGGPLAVHSLVEALENAAYAKEAVKALAMIGPTAFPALAEALSREENQSLIIPALIEIVQSDRYLLPRCRAAEALKAIAAHQPDPALRAALPALRWNNRRNNRRHQNPVFQEALEQIEAVTTASRSLPLPAAAPPPDAKTLPRPAAVPLAVLVTPPQGWWTRLRQRLRGVYASVAADVRRETENE